MFLKLLLVGSICQSIINCSHSIVKRQLQLIQHEICFGSIGCLRTNDDWYHEKYRPRNLEPLDRITIRTTFIFITKDLDDKKPLNFDIIPPKRESFALAGFQNKHPLVILIHDFTSNGFTGWIKHFAQVLLLKKEVNLISVDWQAGAEPPFEQAIANARVVALEIGKLLKILKKDCSFVDHTHLIGHGVGAHIAGYIGNLLPIARITALDPTGAFFEQMPPIVRLDPTDAHFVEVLHTDAFNSRSQGTKTSMGHIDFYINGANIQPGCNQSTIFPPFTKLERSQLRQGTILPGCSHKRSFKYFIEALDLNDCEFTGIKCNNYDDFLQARCTSCSNVAVNGSSCATFGLENANGSASGRNNYYLNTKSDFPYCVNSYQITFLFDQSNQGKSHKEGNFEVIMVDDRGIMVTTISSNHNLIHRFDAEKPHTLIYYAPPPSMKKVVEVRVKWLHKLNTICVFCSTTVYVKEIDVTLLSAFKRRWSQVSRLCPSGSHTGIDNGSYSVFRRCPDDVIHRFRNNVTVHKN